MNKKTAGRLTDSLSFCFGIMFAVLMVIVPLAAGVFSYFARTSENTGQRGNTADQVTSLLKTVASGNAPDDIHGDWQRHAELYLNTFDLAYISLIAVTDDNLRVKHIADTVRTAEAKNSFPDTSEAYFREVPEDVAAALAEAKEKGVYIGLSDIYAGRYGRTVSCCIPVSAGKDGTVMIWTAADMSSAEHDAFISSLLLSLILEALILPISILSVRFIRKRCINRLKELSENIREYARVKSPEIAEQIRQRERDNDEIGVLAQQTASMMSEFQTHIDKIMTISGELLTANERAEKFSELARRDALTGLENKMAYYEAIAALEEQIHSRTAQFALIVIDLNFLKRINDEYGHIHGDAMIKKLAGLIRDFFRGCGAYRIGGDEFAVITEGELSAKALTLAANFRLMLAEGSSAGYMNFPSAAVGCSNYRAGSDTCVRDVFDRADNEMYGNKVQMKAVRSD